MDRAAMALVGIYCDFVVETWAARIVEALRLSSGPPDDDQLALRLGASQRQIVNQVCRRLEADGLLVRHAGSDGKIVNVLNGGKVQVE